MTPDQLVSTLQVGDARVSIITTGAIRVTMASHMRVPPGDWPPEDLELLEQPAPLHMLTLHVALGAASVVVDPMDFVAFLAASGDSPQPYHLVPPRLDRQLAELDVAATSVTHVLITHGHDDHFIGATVQDDDSGGRRPLFPAARYLAERADWTAEGKQAIRDALGKDERDPDLADQVMGELFRRGMVDLVEGDYEVASGIRLLLAKGETPGHAVVRVQSAGATLYYLGDLIHHPIEVEHPDWMPHWADPASTAASRQAIFSAALAEDALLVASHVPGAGRLRRDARGMHWEPVE